MVLNRGNTNEVRMVSEVVGRYRRRIQALVLACLLVALPFINVATARAEIWLVAITYRPDAVTNHRTAEFGLSRTGSTLECKIDTSDFGPCTAEDYYRSDILSVGQHTFTVHVIGGDNPGSTESYTWEIVAGDEPDTSIGDIFPSSPSADLTPSFNFQGAYPTGAGGSFQCSVDDSHFEFCHSPFTIPTLTTTGWHLFKVRAIAANTDVPDSTPATFTWQAGPPQQTTSIGSCTELAAITDLEMSYQLANNIDCDGVTVSPIGTRSTPFKGELRGRGYSIRNLHVDGQNDCGLFGSLLGASVERVHFDAASITCTNESFAGVVAGHDVDSDLSDVIVTNSQVTSGDNSTLGGLIGMAEGFYTKGVNIESSYADTILSARVAGGLVGHSAIDSLNISNSFTRGVLNCDTCGGMVGENFRETNINSSYTDMDIVSTATKAGGMLGYGVFGHLDVTDSFSVSRYDGESSQIGGIVGSSNFLSTNTDNTFYDKVNMPTEYCYSYNTCGTTEDAGYFLGSDEPSAPMDAWDTTIWNLHNEGELPSYSVGTDNCDAPDSITESSYDLACFYQINAKHAYSSTLQSQTARYRVVGTPTWNYQNWSKDTNHLILCGLTPNSQYEVQTRATWNIFKSDWQDPENNLTFTTQAATPKTDRDADGIPDSAEACGPNEGDANNDQSYDREQASVGSFVNQITGKQVALSSTCSTVNGASISTEQSDKNDIAFDYPAGLLDFKLSGCGSQVEVTQYYFGNFNPSALTLRKLNPTSGAYTTISGAQLSNVIIGGQAAVKVVYSITDNGTLDLDPTVGSIHDPVGLALNTVNVPNTGLRRTP